MMTVRHSKKPLLRDGISLDMFQLILPQLVKVKVNIVYSGHT
jgi:hypothetical protein